MIQLITIVIVLLTYDCAAKNIQRFVPVVIAKIPHDPTTFTQGLSIIDDLLYESIGLYGQSQLRRINLLTGKIEKEFFLSLYLFAEGIVAFPDSLLHLTWKEETAYLYDRHSLRFLKTVPYSGEGWGLCREENKIWMSNGTSQLTQRDPLTFAIYKTLDVQWGGQPVSFLNDIECVGNFLYANVWQKEWVIQIDKSTGQVTGVIDASALLTPEEKQRLGKDDVLNGIAFRPQTNSFFLTGKRWPWIFEVLLK